MNGSKCNSVEYTYRPDGLRLSKNVDNNTNRSYYVWSGDNLQAELNASGQIKNYNVYGNGFVKSDTYDSSNNPITVFYAKNAHGDVVNLTDSNGNNVKNYQYDAFGIEVNKDENDFNPFRYCGEYFDNETDNYYLRARYYNPSLGRFITEDPAKDGVNWYSYCGGNPVGFVDPSGKYFIQKIISHSNPKDIKYKILAESYVFTILKSLGNNQIIYGVEKMLNLVGGDSYVSFNKSLENEIKSGVTNAVLKESPILSEIYLVFNILKECGSSLVTGDTDKIAIELMKETGIAIEGKSYSELDNNMKNAKEYVTTNANYYLNSFINTSFGNATNYEIDKKIMKSKNPQNTIKEYVSYYRSYLINNNYDDKFVRETCEKLETYLKSFDVRLNNSKEEFKNVMQ